MKVIALRDAKARLSECVEDAQKDRILITRHGKPAALVIGVEGEELEDLLTRANPKFWEMLEATRQKPTRSEEEVRRYFSDKDSRRPVQERRRRVVPKTKGSGTRSSRKSSSTEK